jgi:hypothetical protein
MAEQRNSHAENLQAIESALAAGWRLHIKGHENSVTVEIIKPRTAVAWLTICGIGGILEVLNRVGEIIREARP